MEVLPKNKNILVAPLDTKPEDPPAVLLPVDYQKKGKYVVARVLKVHESVKSEISEGSLVVAEPNMVREVSIEGNTHYLIQANYILCEVKL
tara:strand:+ start:2015 stop:2287 length:273 start_codon:yes stop_codon:yes gene_type:complete